MRIIRIWEKNMKRIGKLVFAIVLLISMLAGVVVSIVHFTKADKNSRVVVSTFVVYDICKEIMGSDDDITLLMDNGVDMHSYSPTPSDIVSVSKAELFIYVGGESDEKWVPNVIGTAKNVNLDTLSLMDVEGLTLLEESDDNILDDEHNHEHEDGEEEYDEHIWLSLRNMKVMAKAISESLIKVYPEMQELIRINTDKYVEKLQALDEEYSAIKDSEKTLIVADRFPFRYLVHDYNLKYYAVFSGCSAETEASAEVIASLVDKVNTCDVDYLLVLETSDRKVAESCMNNGDCKSGLSILEINSCQSINFSALDTTSYLDIMAKNLENLKKALI